METRLYHKESIRIVVDHKRDNFIDITCEEFETAGGITLYPSMQYIEVRKKDSLIKIYTFKKRSDKKEFDFGWWNDAEVIYVINEVIKQ
jgi:hypothetical protein